MSRFAGTVFDIHAFLVLTVSKVCWFGHHKLSDHPSSGLLHLSTADIWVRWSFAVGAVLCTVGSLNSISGFCLWVPAAPLSPGHYQMSPGRRKASLLVEALSQLEGAVGSFLLISGDDLTIASDSEVGGDLPLYSGSLLILPGHSVCLFFLDQHPSFSFGQPSVLHSQSVWVLKAKGFHSPRLGGSEDVVPLPIVTGSGRGIYIGPMSVAGLPLYE